MRRQLMIGAVVLGTGCGGQDPSVSAGTESSSTGVAPGTAGMTSDDGDDDAVVADSTSADSGNADSTSTDSGPDDETGSSDASTTGGADGPDVDLTDPQLYEFELDPAALDATVVDNIELQYAHLDTRAEPLGKLVFFLSGFTNTPAAWRDHGRQLASYGFHVVEPHYNNGWSCGGMGGDCNTDTRWEALTGEDTSSVIATSRADSAEGRVVTMLLHLAEAHPGGDWGYYLNDDDTLRYGHVIIAGISHGASSTGLFATRRAFSRAVMHSGGWGAIGPDSQTPAALIWGLSHTDDEQHAGHLSAWEQAGLSGAPANIDGLTPPYGDSHRLITSAASTYPHCSVCVHGSSPTEGEAYVFDPAWRAMYGAPAR